MSWDDLEVQPGVYAPSPDFLQIGAAFYGPAGTRLLLEINPIDTNNERLPAHLGGLSRDDPQVVQAFQDLLDCSRASRGRRNRLGQHSKPRPPAAAGRTRRSSPSQASDRRGFFRTHAARARVRRLDSRLASWRRVGSALSCLASAPEVARGVDPGLRSCRPGIPGCSRFARGIQTRARTRDTSIRRWARRLFAGSHRIEELLVVVGPL